METVTTMVEPSPPTFVPKYVPKKTLITCSRCKQPGYQYVEKRDGQNFIFWIHYNLPPVRKEASGRLRYRRCLGSRVYASVEDALQSLHEAKPKSKFKPKTVFAKNPKIINCPECHHRGRLNMYHPFRKRPEYTAFYITHGVIPGTWGKAGQKKHDRCYVHSGPFLEELRKKWQMKKDQR